MNYPWSIEFIFILISKNCKMKISIVKVKTFILFSFGVSLLFFRLLHFDCLSRAQRIVNLSFHFFLFRLWILANNFLIHKLNSFHISFIIILFVLEFFSSSRLACDSDYQKECDGVICF